MTLSDAALLAHITKLPHARATFKQLVKELRANADEREALDLALDRLARMFPDKWPRLDLIKPCPGDVLEAALKAVPKY